MSASFVETGAVGEPRHRFPRGRTAPVHPAVLTTDAQPRDRCPSHARPNSRMISIAHTRQVTVTRIICGVDIASSSLAARIGRDGIASTFANTQPGIAELAAFCESHQVELVAMEATGGYEQRAFAQLSEHGLPVAVLNPRAVRQFAQSMGALEKTDAIDAGMIAWYAETRKSPPQCLAPGTQLELRARVTRLRQLTEVRTAQLNQQRLVIHPDVQRGFRKMLKFLAQQNRATGTGYCGADRGRPAMAPTQSRLPHHQGRGRPYRSAHHGRDAGDRHALQQDHLQTRRTGSAGQ